MPRLNQVDDGYINPFKPKLYQSGTLRKITLIRYKIDTWDAHVCGMPLYMDRYMLTCVFNKLQPLLPLCSLPRSFHLPLQL